MDDIGFHGIQIQAALLLGFLLHRQNFNHEIGQILTDVHDSVEFIGAILSGFGHEFSGSDDLTGSVI